MPFFWHVKIFQTYISKKHKMNKPSLREFFPLFLFHRLSEILIKYSKKRASSFIFKKTVKAGMTLEAALIMPIFLFACLSLISTINIIKIKNCMDLAAVEVGNEITLEYYGGYISDVTMPFYVRQKVGRFLEKNLAENELNKVSGAIFVTDLSYMEEENIVRFRLNYKVTPDFGMLGLFPVKLHTSYYGHKWFGYESGKEMETMVFLSNEASVYHLDRKCTYLNVTIEEISYQSLGGYRNNSRQKYQSCSFCDELDNDGTVFITPEGNNYHNIENCIGLTRHIYTVPLSKVSHKNVCTRCGK